VNFIGNQPMVQLIADGKPVNLLLDTGAETTMLTEETTRRLQLAPDPSRTTVMQGIGGRSTHVNTRVHRLQIAGAMLSEVSLAVAPYNFRGMAGAPPDGLLGADVLANFDVDLDLPHSVVRLFRARDCVLGNPVWNEPAALKADISSGPGRNMLYLPAMLDGRMLTGLVDTGADMATDIGVVDTAAAAASGTTAETLTGSSRIVVHGAAPTDGTARRHRFGSLVIGLETLQHPTLSVTDLPRGSGELLIGVLYARTHRIWISYASHRMYVGYRTPR
jgi:predicted aspartyl protease